MVALPVAPFAVALRIAGSEATAGFGCCGGLTGQSSRSRHASGGLLRTIGNQGIIVVKDFTSLLSEHADTRSRILAALREIYDGRWTRYVGSDGGQMLDWHGKVGLLAGVTEVIDRHLTAMGTMGERFVLYRMPQLDRHAQGRAVLANRGTEDTMRAELSELTAQFLADVDPTSDHVVFNPEVNEQLIELTDFVTLARSPVEREAHYPRDVELVPMPEAIGRMLRALAQLLHGLRAIGLDHNTAWKVVADVALASIPTLRRRILEYLAKHPNVIPSTRAIADAVGYHDAPTKRALDDLAAHRVIERHSTPNSDPCWTLLVPWPMGASATQPRSLLDGSNHFVTAGARTA